MTIVAMILVNNPGSWKTVYWPLLHADWHGWTPTDLIFPFFLFIVGAAVVLAFGRRLEAGADRRSLVVKVARRAAILFALGLFLNGYPFGLFGPRPFERLLETWRVPGVLQRIAVCYLAASVMFLYLRRRTLAFWTVVLLAGYWALMTLVPVPGRGAPDLDSHDGHLAGWVDRAVLGSHMWFGGDRGYDPEGILGTIPALASTLFGVFASLMLASPARLAASGALLALAGYAWGFVFPINKALWTSSYAVFTAGLAMCALALCHQVFDVGGHRAPARPFVIYGVNAITVFVGSGILARTLAYVTVCGRPLQAIIHESLFASWLPPYAASLGYAVAWVAGWLAVLAWMYRRGWVLKV
jgi:predicted acyltransferase